MNNFLAQAESSYAKKLMALMESEQDLVSHECSYRHKNGNKRTLLTARKAIIKLGNIIGYRGAYKDISEIKAHEERIRKLAYLDSLTELPNWSLFNDRLDIVLKTALRSNDEFAVLFIDLDGFKLVNDSMGHDAGDEFAIILRCLDDGIHASSVAEKITKILADAIEIRDQPTFITASVGIAFFPDDGKTSEILLKNADKAMYKAKGNGKNCFCYYQLELEEPLNRTVIIRNLLHTALRNDGFHLLYQPQVNNITRKVSGVEALIRLSDSENHLIGPDEFIPLAEEIGLMNEIGLWVFKTVC